MKRINLLPKQKQTELYFDNLFHSILVAICIAVAVLLFGIFIQIGTWLYLDQSLGLLSTEIEGVKSSSNKTENAELKNQIKSLNVQMKDFDDLAAGTPVWSTVLQSFAKQVPNGVKISMFDADATNGKIQISGYAPKRDQVIELYNNINNDRDFFKDIDYPLENVSQPTDIIFKFTFYVQDGVLIKKK